MTQSALARRNACRRMQSKNVALGAHARVKPEWGPESGSSAFFFSDLCLDPDSGWISTRAHVNPR
jgi:hypothetical protein